MRRHSVVAVGLLILGSLFGVPMSAGASGSPGPVVVVIDSTGFDTANPALAGHVATEVCLDALGGQSWEQAFCPGRQPSVVATGSAMPQVLGGAFEFPDAGHGTAVASEVLAVDPGARLVVIRSLYSFTIGLNWVAQHAGSYNIAAVVYSMAGQLSDPSVRGWVPCDQSTESVSGKNIETKPFIDALAQLNIPVVIAAGNDGNGEYLAAPACISSAVSVGAADGGTVAPYSNVSAQLSILAPGTAVVATENAPGQYGTATQMGTSLAAPYVGGVFALAQSAHPGVSYQEVLAAMRASGTRVNDELVHGIPLVNPQATLALLTAGGVPSLASTFAGQTLVPGTGPAGGQPTGAPNSSATQQEIADLQKQVAALHRTIATLHHTIITLRSRSGARR